jgi:hypothetical protein
MDDLFLADHPGVGAVRQQRAERLAQQSCHGLGDPLRRHGPGMLTVIGNQCAVSGPAKAVRLLKDRVEHRRKIAGRAVDYLQDLRGRGLLLQCLACLGDQPRIFDRDHRLVGEGADQLDLPLAKWLDPLPRQADGADHNALAQQRHAQAGTSSAKGSRLRHIKLWVRSDIGMWITRASSTVRPVTLPRLGGRGPIFWSAAVNSEGKPNSAASRLRPPSSRWM